MRAYDHAIGKWVDDYEPAPGATVFVEILECHTLIDGTPQGYIKRVLIPLDEFYREFGKPRRAKRETQKVNVNA